MDKIIIIASAVLVIGLVLWWFFGKRKTDITVAKREGNKQVVQIMVDGGYKPSVIQLERGVPADLVFIRKDPSSCFEEVVLPDFGKRAKLPVNGPYTITVNPDTQGEFKYACGMNMFFGKVIVK